MDAARQRRARHRPSDHPHLRQRRRHDCSAAPSRSTTIIYSPSGTRCRTRAVLRSRFLPTRSSRATARRRRSATTSSHEGLIGVMGDQGEQASDLQEHRTTRRSCTGTSPTPGWASPTSTGRRRCCPIPTPRCRRTFPPAKSADEDLSDRLSARSADRRARRDRFGRRAVVRRRQGSRRWSASIFRSPMPAATTSSSISTTSIC